MQSPSSRLSCAVYLNGWISANISKGTLFIYKMIITDPCTNFSQRRYIPSSAMTLEIITVPPEETKTSTVLPPRKKTLNRVASSRKGGKRCKINRNIWQTKRTSLGEGFVFGRSTKRNETSVGSIAANSNKALSFPPKIQWNIPFP
ncbi:hypothetical protein AVEN_45380-1 [Araneus ventricosus]|uniref:Uncharacterized protein n=1 Tax=Araneus ventricosus TaxID=182803 RepID=A0A4Y2IWL5_ARAVE|nr:hypothetical protein AVEN_45380-1 [Araneus ventricosus]